MRKIRAYLTGELGVEGEVEDELQGWKDHCTAHVSIHGIHMPRSGGEPRGRMRRRRRRRRRRNLLDS